MPLDAKLIAAWVKAVHGIELPEALAELTAIEMEPMNARALAALRDYDIEGEPGDFEAILEAHAEQQP
ncbi:MAG TPA: hypothetical protein VKZ79_19900 [Alphaproteobacteria bacterium]|nr:hypothetical protein [Alphaproteobacteria bacterium]